MTRLLIVVILVACVGGAALGWVVLSSPPGGGSQAPPDASAAHRFPLGPADVRLDRETPAVAVDSTGRVLLAWAAHSTDGERTLWLARSADGGKTFAKPYPFRKVPVYRYLAKMRGKEVNWSTSVAPRLAAAGETIYLSWTEAIGGGPRVDFLVARTLDGGRTFSEPAGAHGTDAGRPGFTALWAGADGVACAWLDHRRGAQHPFCSLSLPGSSAFKAETLVHAAANGKGICPCCNVDVLRTAAGDTFVAFRDNDANYRDIRVARMRGASGAFEPPVAVTAERWRFEGCPHDGPSLAAAGGRLHMLWMDAHTGKRRVYHASSDLAALRFTGQAVCPEAPGEQGHPRLVAVGDVLHAVWDGSLEEEATPASGHKGHAHGSRPTGSGRAVFAARSEDGGAHFSPARAVAPRPGAFQLNPAAAVAPDGALCVAWGELTEEGKSIACVRVVPSTK